ncbi:putative cyclin protein [Fasciola gigantica]|uniref:Putative cyclin protein n=1 Tax=Fasciola gigantica TaxID=46835 RepID=A0A504YN92_FASGI|nr:putative cyclin protein [Fasciola gigantica]
MSAYEVQDDLDCYKAIIQLFPTGRMTVTSFLQAEWNHFPRQQKTMIQILQQMTENPLVGLPQLGHSALPIDHQLDAVPTLPDSTTRTLRLAQSTDSQINKPMLLDPKHVLATQGSAQLTTSEPEYDNRWLSLRHSHEYRFLPNELTVHEQGEGTILAIGVVTPMQDALDNQKTRFAQDGPLTTSAKIPNLSTLPPVPKPAPEQLLRLWLAELERHNPGLSRSTLVMRISNPKPVSPESDTSHCDSASPVDDVHISEPASAFSLFRFVDLEHMECLNEATPGSGKSVFKPYEDRKDWSVFVESDADEELLFNIPFTGNVKLKAIIIAGDPADQHPNHIELYKNRPFMTFSDTNKMEAGLTFYNQTWERFSKLLATHVFPSTSSCSPSPPENKTFCVDSDELEYARSEVLRLFNKQEYFRQAYNTTLLRMDALASILPPHAQSYLPVLSSVSVAPQNDQQEMPANDEPVKESSELLSNSEAALLREHDIEAEDGNYADDEYFDENEGEEEEIELSPEMVEFMMETIKHRKERDRLEDSPVLVTEPQLHKAPPPKPQLSLKSPQNNESPTAAEINRLETALLHQYLHSFTVALTLAAKLSTQLRRARDRLQTIRSLVQLASIHSDAEHSSLRVPVLPLLAPLVLAQTLSALRCPFVVSDRESDEDAVGLAMHLNCPVISNDSDFYITIPAHMPDTCLLPLRTLTWTPKPCSHPCSKCILSTPRTGKCHYLCAQKFLLDGPAFGRLSPAQRPLFATIIGNDYVPAHRFASFLPCADGLKKTLSGSTTKAMRSNHRCKLYRTMMNWLSGFGDDLHEPIRRLLHRIPITQRSQAWNQLNQSLLSYRVSSSYIQNSLVPFLNLSTVDQTPISVDEITDDIHLGGTSRTLNSSSEDEDDEPERNTPDSGKRELEEPGSEISSLDLVSSDQSCQLITHFWPYSLVCQFRQYNILPVYLDALYSGAAVLNCSVEAVRECPSIHACTDSIRYILYGLILGCSDQRQSADSGTTCTCALKMVDNDVYPAPVTEYARKGAFQIRTHQVFVRAIHPDPSTAQADSRITFLQHVFSEHFDPTRSHVGWLHALSLLSCVWFRHNTRSSGETTPFHCPYFMAFVAIAIVHFLLEQKTRRVGNHGPDHLKRKKRHLLALAHCFHSLGTREKCSHVPLNIYTVHVFGQLQAIFAVLYSLGSVLDGLMGGQESTKCIPLGGVCTLFPSGRVYHALVGYLRRSSSEMRYYLVRNEVLPRLLAEQGEVIIDDALNSLDTYLSLTHLFLGSYTGACEVDVRRPVPSASSQSRKPDAQENVAATTVHTKTKKKKKKQRATQKAPHGLSMKELDVEIERIMLENNLFD